MKKYTAYGAKVRATLLERGQSMADLAKQVTDRTGLYCDQQYLYKIFTEERNGPRIVEAINDILGLT